MSLILAFIGGILAGCGIAWIIVLIRAPKKVGTVVVDHSDLDGPHLFLELHDHDWYATFLNEKEVLMTVEVRDYLPQK